tara:strand:+ start:138 stop:1151 length:1014 start_codon:yes stop_codon:yes gene_type:complete
MTKNFFFSLIFFFILIFTTLVSLEFASRLYLYFVKNNYCAKTLNFEKYESKADELLGYIPKKGSKIGCNGEKYTINNEGFRTYKGFNPSESNHLIIGDSFGFGDELDDSEALSYLLYKDYDIKNINAAVYGYGVDQMTLRALEIIKNKEISKVIMITSPGGIDRVNKSVRNNVKKPFYLFDGKKLVLNKPGYQKIENATRNSLINKSFFIRFSLIKLGMSKYLVNDEMVQDNLPYYLKSCKILENFQEKLNNKNINFDVVLYRDAGEIIRQKKEQKKLTDNFLKCLDEINVKYLDTYEILRSNKDKKLFIKHNFGHPTLVSNLIVSKYFAEYTKKNW